MITFTLTGNSQVIPFGSKDSLGVDWHVQDIDGWDSPEGRWQLFERLGRHGQLMGNNYYSGRPITLTNGHIFAPNEAACWDARRRLAYTTDLIDVDGILLVNEPSVAKYLNVRRAGHIRIRQLTDRACNFEVPLIALDPIKYALATRSITINSGNSGILTNGGNFPVWPTVVVNAGNPTIMTNNFDGAKAVRLNNAGTFTIDFANRNVTLGAFDFYQAVDPSTAWWRVLPGDNSVSVSGGSATFTWHDGYI